MITVTRVDHIALTVRDLKQSERFYREILGFKPLGPIKGHVFMESGEVELALFQVEDPKKARDPGGWGNIDVQHVAFTVDKKQFETAQAFLSSRGVQSEGPVDHGTALSIYFKDPDGNTFELTYNKES
ncbi:MAG: VOC family protein [Planctomycetes bacterium]|nr:VOC family protein [Planctomycetota bacterium]